jgi:hypothetical protein
MLRFTDQGVGIHQSNAEIKMQKIISGSLREGINNRRGNQSQQGTRQSFNQEQSTGVDSWEKTSFAHHPRTEKQGIRIYRSIMH